ncbi:MAG: YdcF family protein [Candidatus Saccharimonadales bacterium]|jgi:uncharacterized SAM-binding protein YcdF (DUF218 family)
MIRMIVGSMAVIAGLVIFVVPSYLGPDDLKDCAKPQPGTCAAADAIVAISGGDTTARTGEAIKLYKEGWGNRLIFSGAAADKTGLSNALAMKKYALGLGVPESDISIEEFSQTTAENAVNTGLFIHDNNIKRIILVTSAYHQKRASLEFRARLGSDVEIINHPVAHDRQWGEWWWATPSGLWLAFSELVKILIFYVTFGTIL